MVDHEFIQVEQNSFLHTEKYLAHVCLLYKCVEDMYIVP